MSEAGYSGTPLATKLGIKEGHRVAVLSAPAGFAALLGELPEGARLITRLGRGAEIVLCFCRDRRAFARRLPGILVALPVDGAIWIAWPKRSSGVPTDMTEDAVREVALPTGLVDNKVCAIDATWSGLRLVIRKELRASHAARASAAGSGKAPRGA